MRVIGTYLIDILNFVYNIIKSDVLLHIYAEQCMNINNIYTHGCCNIWYSNIR